ncbi:MAG: hypothetical protein AAF903_12525 [Pseudomonadota bacterium]
MMKRVLGWDAQTTAAAPVQAYDPGIAHCLEKLSADPYIKLADGDLRFISVFDDLHYDRADMDLLSEPMRRHAINKLLPFGYFQSSGSVIEHRKSGARIHMPKFRVLGCSSFDTLRETKMGQQDYALLTPTQAAAQIITRYPVQAAKERVAALIVHHPANLLRLFDSVEPGPNQSAIRSMLGELVHLQKKSIAQTSLGSRRALT